MKIIIINGPNLNLLGTREPKIYGSQTFLSYLEELKKEFPEIRFSYFQSNIEGEIIDEIQKAAKENVTGIILNAGAYSHTSLAIADALSSVSIPTVEVHISNIFSRETYRHHSYITPNCVGMIAGLGLEGYKLATEFLKNKDPRQEQE